mgnify:FL=1
MPNLTKIASDLRYVNQGAVLVYSSENERIGNGGPPESEDSENERIQTISKPKTGGADGTSLYTLNGDGTATLAPNADFYTDNGDGTITLNHSYASLGDGTYEIGN